MNSSGVTLFSILIPLGKLRHSPHLVELGTLRSLKQIRYFGKRLAHENFIKSNFEGEI
jgi:hypothetical protein